MFLYYPYLIIANLFTKHLPTLVSEKYYTIKKVNIKITTNNYQYWFYQQSNT